MRPLLRYLQNTFFSSSTGASSIYVYSDHGVSLTSLLATLAALKRLRLSESVRCVTGHDIVSAPIPRSVKCLIMPGGRARPFYRKLGSTVIMHSDNHASKVETVGCGNQNIIDYVKQGGSYFGICAGAYYAAAQTKFAVGLKQEICDEGALNLYAGTAVGPVTNAERYSPWSAQGATAVNIYSEEIPNQAKGKCYFNGGCSFYGTDSRYREVAHYANIDNEPPAVLFGKVGLGKVVLSGIHMEMFALHNLSLPLQVKLACELNNDRNFQVDLMTHLLKYCLSSQYGENEDCFDGLSIIKKRLP